MRGSLALACLSSISLALVQACSSDTFTPPTDGGGGADTGASDAGASDGGANDAQAACPLKLLNKNTSFEDNDGVWALSNTSTTFVTKPRTGLRSLHLAQVPNANFAFAKQDIGGGHTFVRLWYRKEDTLPEFQTMRLEIQPGGVQRTFGGPWPTTWTCATARVDSGDGGAGTFFVSGYQATKDAGASVFVDDVEVFEIPADDIVPKSCECPN